MKPDQVIEKMKESGVTISRQTLRNYEKWHLIPEAKRGNAGRGRGRTTDYPDNTPNEALKVFKSFRDVKANRDRYLAALEKIAITPKTEAVTFESIQRYADQVAKGGPA